MSDEHVHTHTPWKLWLFSLCMKGHATAPNLLLSDGRISLMRRLPLFACDGSDSG